MSDSDENEDLQLTKKQLEQLEKERIKEQRDLLSIEPEERDEDDVNKIMKYLKNVKFFKEYRNKPQYYDLCKHIYVETFEQGNCIFKQGDVGDSAYVILSGEIVIYIDEPTEYRGFMTLKEKARLKKGELFGQLALKNNQSRTATAKAGQRTDLIVIQKQVFNQYFAEVIESKPQLTPHLRKLKSFLEGLDMFQLMSADIIDNLTTKCDIKKFPSNTIILKQGNDAAALYFVRQGKLKCVRLIPFRINPITREKIVGEAQDPSNIELKQGNYVNEFIEIDELSDQDIFGDYSLLYQTEIDHSVITSVPSELVYINIFYINQIVPEENLQVYKKSLKKYPNNTELRLLYWEKRNWEKYRKALMNNIILSKANKRTFQNQLRLPLLKANHKKPPFNHLDIKTSDSNLYFQVLNENDISKKVKSKKKIKMDLQSLRYNHDTQTGQNLTLQLNKFNDNLKAYTSSMNKELRRNQSVRQSLPTVTLQKSIVGEDFNKRKTFVDVQAQLQEQQVLIDQLKQKRQQQERMTQSQVNPTMLIQD